MLEAIAGGKPDGRQPMFLHEGQGSGTVRRCGPGTQESTNSSGTGAPHTFVERMTQKRKAKRERDQGTDTGIEHARWRATGNGGETGLNVINGFIRAELCVAQ